MCFGLCYISVVYIGNGEIGAGGRQSWVGLCVGPGWNLAHELCSSEWANGKGSNRVNRGGSWNNTPANARVANRNNWQPDNRNNNLGFRLASTGKCSGACFFTEKQGVKISVQPFVRLPCPALRDWDK